MFVLEAAEEGAALALADVGCKEQLPFDEYVVVAGRVQSARQLTCMGGRVKRDGKRRVLVLPLATHYGVAQTTDVQVQVLDVGEMSVRFLQEVRACFPTLVRKNPMAMPSDSDDSDSYDSDSEEAHKKQKTCESETALTADSSNGSAPAEPSEAVLYMHKTRVKMLSSLDELASAFPLADPTPTCTALRNDPSFPRHCQLLCVDCPALQSSSGSLAASGPASSASGPPVEFNFGVMYSEAVGMDKQTPPQYLQIPVPRSVSSAAAQASDEVLEIFQDATVLSFGTHREATAHGGGKSCDEMIKNIRMRHASGTFCTLVLPSKTWMHVAEEYQAFLPLVRELRGELRLRRLMGATPIGGAPVSLLLES